MPPQVAAFWSSARIAQAKAAVAAVSPGFALHEAPATPVAAADLRAACQRYTVASGELRSMLRRIHEDGGGRLLPPAKAVWRGLPPQRWTRACRLCHIYLQPLHEKLAARATGSLPSLCQRGSKSPDVSLKRQRRLEACLGAKIAAAPTSQPCGSRLQSSAKPAGRNRLRPCRAAARSCEEHCTVAEHCLWASRRREVI
eukprot:SM000024S07736  [mRNA]  locus=s24:122948:123742:+ [translate_table: standard]